MYIFHGQDDFSLREALNELKARLGPAELLATNTTLLEGHDLTLDHLAAVCNTVPFLAEYRLVVVNDLLSRWGRQEGRGRRRGPGPQERSPNLGEWSNAPGTFQAMPATTALVITNGRLNRDNPFLKLLAPVAQVTEFIPLKGQRLRSWAQTRVAQSSGTISATAMRLLADFAGTSLWTLASEIDKLCLYAEGRSITDEDVRRLVPDLRESSIFALVDAVVEGKKSRAYRELNQLVESGASASYILAMLARQFRMLALSKSLEQKGVPMQDMGRRLGIASEYALGKVLDQVALYEMEEITRAYEMILSADLAFKTGELPERLALELLVMELAGNRSRRGRPQTVAL